MTEPQIESGQGIHGVIQPKGFPGLPAGWVAEWETFPSADKKVQLFAAYYHPEKWESPRALIISHGIGEHGGRYLHFPHFVKDSVGLVYCPDHRGHGRSEGLRGHVDRFDLYAEDLRVAIRRVDEKLRKRFGRSEIHLLGHSLGGLIALRAVTGDPRLPLASLILSAPLFGIKVKVPLAKRAAGEVLSRVWGWVQMTSEVNPAELSHDPEVARTYVEDRLVHAKVTPRLFTEMVKAFSESAKKTGGVEVPVLMLLPGEDKVTDADLALKFFHALQHRDKHLKTYPGFFHESFNEVGKERAFEDLNAWLRKFKKSGET